MGLLDIFWSEFIDVIEWVEQENDIVLYKFPDKDKAIKMGAQLTVRDSQQALFVNEGQIADLFSPGRHELVTKNMPILTKLKSWKYGFDSPFKCDVYYFSTKQFTNLKWGTPNPIMMRDPQFKQVRVQAFGVYIIRVVDPVKMFKEFTGTASILRIAEIEERLRGMVVSKFAEALAETQVSVLDMVANYTEIGQKLKPQLQEICTPFGIELVQFDIASTTLPPEVTEFYDKMTNMNMVGDDMAKFQQFTTITSLEEAAKSGGAGNMTGIGAGMLFTNLMNNNLQNPPQQEGRDVAPPTAEPSKEDLMNMLKQLGELKTSGILTEEEFEAKKKDILARL